MTFASRFYSRERERLTGAGILLLGLGCALLLLPLLLYPLGPDSSLFFVAGQKIVDQGAVHYRDIVDVKPPLIYYLNAVGYILFGGSEVTPRLLDYLIQLASAMLLFLGVRRAGKSDRWAAVTALLYAVLYIGVSAQGTTQTESLVAPLLALSILLYFGGRETWRFFLIGVLCGIAALFKFTLGILLVGFLFTDLLVVRRSGAERIRRYLGAIGGTLAIGLLFLLYLTLFDAWTGLDQMREWTAGYAGMQFASIGSFVGTVLTKAPVMLADEYSLAMLIGTIVATWSALFGRSVEASDIGSEEQASSESTGTLLLTLMTVQFFLLVATVVIEGKWMHYHVMRFYAPGAVLATWGLLSLLDRLRDLPNRRLHWIVVPLFAFLLLGTSPVSRYFFHSWPAVKAVSGGDGAFDDYYGELLSGNGWSYREIDAVGSAVGQALEPDEQIHVISGVASLLYLRADRLPETSVFHSGFVIAPYAPKAWRAETISYIVEKRPRFLIFHTNDRMPMITMVDSSSWERVQTWPTVMETLAEDYEQVDSTNSFLVFEKSSDGPTRYRRQDREERVR